MEAGTTAERRLDSDKARRIVEAMRASVALRGAAGSTFDHVAQEAGVSRGLLHYYFGSKERLLVEVVRHDCEARIGAMDERIARAESVDGIIAALVVGLEEFIKGEPGSQAVIYEMLSASRRSEELRAELAELYRRWRAHIWPTPCARSSARAWCSSGPTRSRWPPCCSRWATASASR
jgi:AcrR family transcriptional regulator